MGTRFIALLRGINIGKSKRIGMAELRKLMEEAGYEGVRTLLNSGNIVFDSDRGKEDAERRIHEEILEHLGVDTEVTVLTSRELDTIVSDNPLSEIADNHSKLLVTIPKDPAGIDNLGYLTEQNWLPEVLSVGSRAVYVWCPGGVQASKLMETIGRAYKDQITSRNWSTILKLHALCTINQEK